MKLKINMSAVRDVNYTLPPMITKMSGIQRGVGLLRWRVPAQLQQEREIGNRLAKVHREAGELVDELAQLYDMVNHCIDMYDRTERQNDENASQFK